MTNSEIRMEIVKYAEEESSFDIELGRSFVDPTPVRKLLALDEDSFRLHLSFLESKAILDVESQPPNRVKLTDLGYNRFLDGELDQYLTEPVDDPQGPQQTHQQRRFDLLRSIYELAEDDVNKPLALAEAANKIGAPTKESLTSLDYLENEGLVKVLGVSGDERALTITHQGLKRIEAAMETTQPTPAAQAPTETTAPSSPIKLFISHSSHDATLAEALIDFLRSAVGLQHDEIRCTSVDGYRLPAGADTDDQIRQEISHTTSFIGLLSPASLQSVYVAFELGARWGARMHLVPLLAPGIRASQLEGPISQLNALRVDERSQLHQLASDLANKLDLGLGLPAAYERQLEEVLQVAKDSIGE